jgi:Uma2 family endonuclease
MPSDSRSIEVSARQIRGDNTVPTITRQPPPSAPLWIPKRLARLTVDQYEAMVDSGVFTKRDRFTLINGYLAAKVPKSPRHTVITKNLAKKLQRLFPSGWDFRIEDAVRLADSKPEPDLSIARGDIEDYADRDPGPADLAMVVEIAASRVSEDRQMAKIYGAAGIPVYWIVNVKAQQVEVYPLSKRRGPAGYGKPRVFKAAQSVPVLIEGVEIARLAVAEILPRIEPAVGGNGA